MEQTNGSVVFLIGIREEAGGERKERGEVRLGVDHDKWTGGR